MWEYENCPTCGRQCVTGIACPECEPPDTAGAAGQDHISNSAAPWWHIHRMHRTDLYAIGPGTRYGHHATEERQCRCGLTERRRVRIPLAPTPPMVKR